MMRYEARGKVVYDRETDTVVEVCANNPAAHVAAAKANKADQEWREFDSLMRTNRSVCG